MGRLRARRISVSIQAASLFLRGLDPRHSNSAQRKGPGMCIGWARRNGNSKNGRCECIVTNREKPPRPNRISFYLFNLDGGLGEGSYFHQPVRPGEWIHVTAVAGEGNTAIYKNGEYMRCDEYNGPSGHGCQAHGERIHPSRGNAPLRLGTRDLKSFFQGGLSQVRIWNRLLRPDEVRRLYTSDDVPRQGLAAEFLLDRWAKTSAE